MLAIATLALAFAAEVSPLRKLALNTANAAANDIVETNYLLDPNGVCVDCSPAQRAAAKKTLLPPQARAAIARSRLWYANKLLAIDDSQWMSNPVMARIVAKPRKSLSLLVLLLYVGLPAIGLGPWLLCLGV